MRLPKYFRPYARIHYKKAFRNELPDPVMNNKKYISHAFHRIGYQKSYASTYRKFLMTFLNSLKDNSICLKMSNIVLR